MVRLITILVCSMNIPPPECTLTSALRFETIRMVKPLTKTDCLTGAETLLAEKAEHESGYIKIECGE